MPAEDIHLAHLNAVIDHLKSTRAAVIRGYEQAMEELGREGDYWGKDWSAPYEFLKKRVAEVKAEDRKRSKR